ncbi:MAG: hypothetical protein K6B71_03125 [Alphaproteobacteria bacterium]|nr:hypothetical protein [Alphaproteobacteria bacterium]
MKKTLLSVLAGLTVMGSAFADGPSVEDRKKLCQLLIDKGTHVWVEKTEACIPINPCHSDDSKIKEAYCIYPYNLYFASGEAVEIFAKKYANNILKTDVAKTNVHDSVKTIEKEKKKGYRYALEGGYFYLQMHTTDGGFYSVPVALRTELEGKHLDPVCIAFGKNGTYNQMGIRTVNYCDNVNEQEFYEMKDFLDELLISIPKDKYYTIFGDMAFYFHIN